MVRPDRRRGMVPMRYDAPITTDYWDDDGSDAYREMFARESSGKASCSRGSHAEA